MFIKTNFTRVTFYNVISIIIFSKNGIAVI